MTEDTTQSALDQAAAALANPDSTPVAPSADSAAPADAVSAADSGVPTVAPDAAPPVATDPVVAAVPADEETLTEEQFNFVIAFGDGDGHKGTLRLIALAKAAAQGPVDQALFGSIRMS